MHIKKLTSMAFAVVLSVGLLNLGNLVSAVVPGINERVSVRSTSGSGNGSSGRGLLSPNGKFIVFRSEATNILPTGGKGVFMRNLASGSILRINVSSSGVLDDGVSTVPQAVSTTGRYVVFKSTGTNLIDGTTIAASASNPQFYLRDTVSATTTLVSQNSSGVISNGNAMEAYSVSSDGRFVLYRSNATNLHPDSTTAVSHLYLLDRNDNSLTIVDRKTDGSLAGPLTSGASMSCDGSLIVFGGDYDLIVGDGGSHAEVYLYDRRGSQDKLTNLTKFANAGAFSPTISCNGDYIGFSSPATNIDTSVSVTYYYNKYRPYIYDRVNDAYYFAAVTYTGSGSNVAVCGTLSDSGPCIRVGDNGIGVFSANDSNLTGASGQQVYLRDPVAGITELISRDSAGTAGDGASSEITIDAKGSISAYASQASNLVVGGWNGYGNIFTSRTGY